MLIFKGGNKISNLEKIYLCKTILNFTGIDFSGLEFAIWTT